MSHQHSGFEHRVHSSRPSSCQRYHVRNARLAALIGSRICHDLISPIGAIGNGVELMLMEAPAKGPELSLISESVANANARIRYFRIAFGAAGPSAIGRPEVLSILSDLSRGGRIGIGWQSSADLSRREVRLAFLALQCAEAAMPYGGQVSLQQTEKAWQLLATAERFKIDAARWDGLTAPALQPEPTPALVQFALLPDAIARGSRILTVERTETQIRMAW
jgi:histidine phosphotransferase ChpT